MSAPLERDITWSSDLAIAAVFQNETRWLQEWVEYHLLIGVQHFYLYNNLSRDNYHDKLQAYIERGTAGLATLRGSCLKLAISKRF
jgi:hypothetical protein